MRKKEFIEQEIWLLTTMGAFQRSGIYEKKTSKDFDETARKEFRRALEKIVRDIATEYNKEVEPVKHITNIEKISKETSKMECSKYLTSGKLNFGVCQKMLNLYLKYSWVFGLLEIAPPHFPIDSIIQKELNKAAKKCGITEKVNFPWTKMKDAVEYNKIISLAEEIVKATDNEFENIAELELALFERT